MSNQPSIRSDHVAAELTIGPKGASLAMDRPAFAIFCGALLVIAVVALARR